MADIANTTVFTNGAVSCGTSDLLRQAFREVVEDDEDRDNDFVTYLHHDNDGSPTIHLTQAQATALRLTFEVDTEANSDITYGHEDENDILVDIAARTNLDNEERIHENDALESMVFSAKNPPSNVIIKTECPDFEEWTGGNALSRDEENNEISIEDPKISANNTAELVDRSPKIYITQAPPSLEINGGHHKAKMNYTESPRNLQSQDLRDSQAQILQRFPVILPSSQFVVKPAQTLLKSAKNVRILPGGSKLAHSNGVNGVSTSTHHNIGSSQNSILLPKGTLLNTLAPRLIKATTIPTQLISNGGVSTRLVNASHILTSPCEFQNHSGSQMNANVPLTPAVKGISGIIRSSNNQQFIVPSIKTNHNGAGLVKILQTTNGNGAKSEINGSFLKSMQIPMLHSGVSLVKTPGTTRVTTSNSPLILRTAASILKSQDVKSTCASSVLRPTTQNSPVSILKPQTKLAFSNGQTVVSNSNITSGFTNNLSSNNGSNANTNNSQTHQRTIHQTSETYARKTNQENGTANNVSKYSQNFVREKIVDGSTNRFPKRPKVYGVGNSVSLTPDQSDTTKPLGSSENPIQIVQQGHTFHSMQRLSQSQLKQIVHVLEQRSQEAAMPNERIVYRVVFPEELDLRMRNPGNLLKGRGGKRGRPKKTAVRPTVPTTKVGPPTNEEEHEETKDDRKKVMARTRSGRLSRPPRHMVRDYKHLHHLDFMQPDLDDSDGGYSDYNTNTSKSLADDSSPKELLSGLEIPKRKISDHFRCPTCNKIYLGRSRMERHFEMHKDHGSPEQLPPPTQEPELKSSILQDPLKRKGKKRGPWAYVTPEAKSERRQSKLKEAISACDNVEIVKIAAKPVLDVQSLYELLILKSEHNVRNFLEELKDLTGRVRDQVGTMLSLTNDTEHEHSDVINITDDALCDVLGVDPGVYRINNGTFKRSEDSFDAMSSTSIAEPPLKIQKTDETKDQLEERISSGFSESSDLSVSDFLNERKAETHASTNCPEVLVALTLMPRNPSPATDIELTKSNSMSKLLISNPEIQNQLSENRGFRKIDINSSKSYRKLESLKDGFTKLDDGLEIPNCSNVFDKLDYEEKQPLSMMETLQQAFIKPMEENLKLEEPSVAAFPKPADSPNYDKINYDGVESNSQNFVKGFHKIITKLAPNSDASSENKTEEPGIESQSEKMLVDASICKINENLPIIQDSIPIMGNNCDSNIFGTSDNLDISKITGYDSHLDMLTNSVVMDKHLIIDEKLVEQLHLVDQSSLVDELVSERLKNIMPDNLLDNNLMPTASGNLDGDLDFEALSEEFNRNTPS